ncbi:MAG: Wzz/FepE/Etk N-terminal domain-containing protein [Haloechinothrix sp.]
MTLEEFVQLLKRQWRIVAAVTVMFVLAAFALGFVVDRSYQASATLVVTPSSEATPAAGARAPMLISASGMETYAQLATSLDVATGVVQELELAASPAQVQQRLVASVPTNTYLIDMTATASTGDEAARIINAAAEQATVTVNKLFGEEDSGFALAVASRADPSTVVPPNAQRFLPIGAVVGIMIGIAVAVIREILDHRVRDDDDLRRSFGVAPLAQVSLARSRDGLPLLDPGAWDESTLESVRRLRTTLQMRPNPPRTILIAGASGGEGGSTVAALLAQVSAAAGAKTMLVECDLREPRIASRLGFPVQPGLTDFLSGNASFGEVVFDASARTLTPTPHRRGPVEIPHTSVLGVVAAGSESRRPGELLSSAKFREFLATVSPFYDTIIFGGAAILPYADSVAVSTAVDATVLVVAAGQTPRRDIDQAIAQLAAVRTDVSGVVLASQGRKGGKQSPAVRHIATGSDGAR